MQIVSGHKFYVPIDNDEKNKIEVSDRASLLKWIVFDLFLLIFMVRKLIEVIRVNETLSLQVKLLKQALSDILSFIVFFMFWIIIITIVYKIFGVDLIQDKGEYKYIPIRIASFL